MRRAPGLPRMARQRAAEIVAAAARAQALPDDQLPRPPRVRPPVVPPAVKRRVEALRAWRAQAAARRLALDVSLVLPQRLLDKVAEAAPRDPRRSDRWRACGAGGCRSWAARSWTRSARRSLSA